MKPVTSQAEPLLYIFTMTCTVEFELLTAVNMAATSKTRSHSSQCLVLESADYLSYTLFLFVVTPCGFVY